MNKVWITEPNGYLEPRITPTRWGSMKPKTIIEAFQEITAKHGDKRAMCYKSSHKSEWKVWTWQEYWNDSLLFAKSLLSLGIQQFEVINILGFNAPEWMIANNGSVLAGCIGAGIYITNLAAACQYISEHSKAQVIVLEGNKQLTKYVQCHKNLPKLKYIVVWGEDIDPAIASQFDSRIQLYTFSKFMELGKKVSDQEVDVRWSNVKAGHCATLIYTSGTTGPPKATMLSHDNVTWTAANLCEHFGDDLNHTESVVSYLPLSHIAAQLIDIYLPIHLGGCVYFAQPDVLKGSLTATLKDVRPTIFFGVPRVWEKIHEKMVEMGRNSDAIKKFLGAWAKSVGAEKSKRAQFGGDGGAPCTYSCANALVLSKVKQALGLDNIKVCATGAAPITLETLNYFASLDIHILEGFGQSECSGPHTMSGKRQWKIGYCGRPLQGTESIIDKETGELCYRGRHIFMGYMYMPEQTAATIDKDGYLHSGDMATFDENNHPDVPAPSGFLKITGRIKELLITAGGENIPPVLIENEMKIAMPALSNCMVIGDRRKYLTMLVSLSVEVDLDTGLPSDQLTGSALLAAKEIGSNATTYTEAKNDPLWAKYVDAGMKKGNSCTASNAQIVQKWRWLPVDFSEKNGDLTATSKLKRNVVTEKYATLIDSMYAAEDEK